MTQTQLNVRRKPGPKRKPDRFCVHCGAGIKRISKVVRCQSCAAKQRKRKPRISHEEKLRRRRVLSAKWRAKNREKLNAYFRAYDSAHRDIRKARYRQDGERLRAIARVRTATPEARAKSKAYRKANKTARNATRDAWVRRNPERAKAIEIRRRLKNRERKRAADREYRRLNPETCKAGIARAKAARPDHYKQVQVKSSLARRARRKQVVVERVSLPRIVARDHGRCHLCSQPVERRHRSFDHLIPIVRLGAHAEWNLMLAHLVCNMRRGTKQILQTETREAAEAYIAAHVSETEVAA